MKEMYLTQGKFALVDDADYEWLSKWKWCACKNRKTFYAARRVLKEDRMPTTIYMHQVIMGKPTNGLFIDHIDGNGANNQRSNLRLVTHRQNLQNRHESQSSKYAGVSWNKKGRKWKAQIRIGKTRKHLGFFTEEEKAYSAYCDALRSIGERLL